MATNKQFNAEQGLSVGTGNTVIDSSGDITTQTISGRSNNTNISITPQGTGTVIAPSINKVAITQPATGATLTIANGKTLTVNETFTMTALAGSIINFGSGGTIAFGEEGGFIYDSVTTLASLTGVGNIVTGTWNANIISLGKGGTGSNLTDPNADRIMFWDDSSTAVTWLATGNSLSISGTTIDTIQDIRSTAIPTFGGLVINGDLTVTGQQNILNVNQISVDDKNITLGDVVAITNLTFASAVGSNSVTFTGSATTAGMVVGEIVTMTGGVGNTLSLPNNTTIVTIPNSTQITISAVFSGSGTTGQMNTGGASDYSADGGGITIKGATDKTIIYDRLSDNFKFNKSVSTSGGQVNVTGSTNPYLYLGDGTTNAYVQVSGNVLNLHNSANAISFSPSGSGQFYFYNGYMKFGSDSGYIRSDGPGYLKLQQGSSGLYIMSPDNANVRFGQTPQGNTAIYADANSAWALTIGNTGTSAAHGLYVNITDDAGIPFRVDRDGIQRFTADASGNAIASADFQTPSTAGRLTFTNASTAGNGGVQNNNGTSYLLTYPSAHSTKPSHLDLNSSTRVALQIASSDILITTSAGISVNGSLAASGGLQTGGYSQLASTLIMSYNAIQAARIGIKSTGSLVFGLDGSDGSTERMYIDISGNLLLGAGSTTSRLDGVFGMVIGSSSKTSAGLVLETTGSARLIYTDQVNNLRFYDSVSNSEQMILDGAGNLGLGVAPSTYSGLSTGRLEFGAIGNSVFSNGSGNSFYTANVNYNAGYKYATTGNAALYMQSTGTHGFYVTPSGTAGTAISWTQALNISATGIATFPFSMYAPMMYDNDNTGYYCDPAGVTRLNVLKPNVLNFYGSDSLDSGVTFPVNHYSIGQSGGAWSSPFPDLIIGYHTGIRIGAYPAYGGVRFYDNSPTSIGGVAGAGGETEIFSVGNGDGHIRALNTIYAYQYKGNGNIGGTGEAIHAPAGIYSTGTNWLYGTIITNNNAIQAGTGSISGGDIFGNFLGTIDGFNFSNTGGGGQVDSNLMNSNGISYVNPIKTGGTGAEAGTVTTLFGVSDGALYSQAYSSIWQHQIYGDYRSGQIAVRGKNSDTWQPWRNVLDSSNFNNHAPTLTGTGASGTWGISITGSAASASVLTSLGNYVWDGNALGNTYATGVTNSFVYSGTNFPNYGNVLNIKSYPGDGGFQMWTPYGTSYGVRPAFRFANYNNSGAWTAWKDFVVEDGASYGISITGNAATATLASTVTVTSSNSSSLYNMVWNNGNYLYNTDNIYCNPATDYLYAGSFVATNWFRTTDQTGLYSTTYGTHIYPVDALRWAITGSSGSNISVLQFRGTAGSAVYGSVYAASSDQIGFTSSAETWMLRVGTTGSSWGTMGVYGRRGSGTAYAGIQMEDSGTVIGAYDSAGNGGTLDTGVVMWQYYWNKTNQCLAIGGSDTLAGFRAHTNGHHYVYGDITANSLIDRENSAYYVDPGSTSRLNVVEIQTNGSLQFWNTGARHGILIGNSEGCGFVKSDYTGWAARVNAGTVDWYVLGNVTAYSDERVKKNWRPVQEDFISKLSQVKSGVYDRTDTDLTQVGVSAQSLQEVMPEAVVTNESGELSVAYGNAALAACIEMAKEIVALKAMIEEMKRGQ